MIELDNAKKEIAILRTALVRCRMSHDGFNYDGQFIACTPEKREEEGHCVCGADAQNAFIDAALSGDGCPGIATGDGNYSGCIGAAARVDDCPVCRSTPADAMLRSREAKP